jgi:hypothetical protein
MTFGTYDHSPNGQKKKKKRKKWKKWKKMHVMLIEKFKQISFFWFSSIHGQHLGVNNRLV